MDKTTEKNIIENINYIWILSDAGKNILVSLSVLIFALGFIIFLFNKPMAIIHIAVSVVCLAITIYTIKMNKKHLIKAAIIRSFSAFSTLAVWLISLGLVLVFATSTANHSFLLIPPYIVYCVIVAGLFLASFLGYTILKPSLAKKNFYQKKPKNHLTTGSIVAISVGLSYSRIGNSLSEQNNYSGWLVFVMIILFLVMFFQNVGVRLIYLEILHKNPELIQKCIKARPEHEQKFAETNIIIAKYLEKKRAEENSNIH